MEKQLEKLKTTLKCKLKDKSGGIQVFLMACIFFFIGSIIFMMCFEVNRNMFITTKVQNTITDGVVYAARNNLYESFATIRQGNSGAYEYSGSYSSQKYKEIIDVSGFKKSLCKIYDLTETGSTLSKKIDGAVIWQISNIKLYVKNANHEEHSEYRITYDLVIPHQFFWKDKDDLKIIKQQQTIQFKEFS